MVTAAIVAILAAIAVPRYTGYVMKGKIPQAAAGLAGKQAQMEQYYQDQMTYVGAPPCNADSTLSKNFDFSCEGTPTTTTYTLKAVGKGQRADFTFTVDQSGTRKTTSVPSGWTKPADNCWTMNEGGSC